MFSHMETGVTSGCNAGFLQAANNDAELMVQDRGNPGFSWNQERLVVWSLEHFLFFHMFIIFRGVETTNQEACLDYVWTFGRSNGQN